MGSYGIGPGRVMAAAVEQHHDEHGIIWPRGRSPYDVHIVTLPGLDEQGEAVASALEAAGARCSSTTARSARGEVRRRGPARLSRSHHGRKKTLEDSAVDVRDRATGEERRVPMAGQALP